MYAEYLGMDPKEDADLLWIAEEALTSVEPEGWIEKMDPNGQPFYYNVSTGQSSRQHPLDEHYKSLYLKLKTQRTDALASSNELLANEILAAAKEKEEAQRMRREAALKERAAARKVRQLTRTNSMSHQQTQQQQAEDLFVNPKSSRADAVAVRDAPGKERRRSSVAAATSENDERFRTHRDPLPQEAHRSPAESSSTRAVETSVYL